MTTKTIPAYLEDERQKERDAQLRTEEEAARIQPLRHGRHRIPKQPKLELRSAVKAAPKARKNTASLKKQRKPDAGDQCNVGGNADGTLGQQHKDHGWKY